MIAEVIDIYRPHRQPRREHLVGDPHFLPRVECGLFGISDDYIEKYQSLDARFIKNKASTFFFEASSHSMQPLINEGDVLVVDRSIEQVNNRVVVVALEGEMICKRFVKKNNQVILKSENPKCADIKVTEEMNMIVFGVVVSIAREIVWCFMP